MSNDNKTKLKLIDDDFLINVKLQLPNKIIEGKFSEETLEYDLHDPESITNTGIKLPSQYAKFAIMLHTAETIKKDVEIKQKKWYAEKRKDVTQRLIEKRKLDKNKAPTKEDIDTEIKVKYAEEYDKFENRISNLENKIGILKIAVNTLEMKKSLFKGLTELVQTMINHELFAFKGGKFKVGIDK